MLPRDTLPHGSEVKVFSQYAGRWDDAPLKYLTKTRIRLQTTQDNLINHIEREDSILEVQRNHLLNPVTKEASLTNRTGAGIPQGLH